MTKEKQPEQQPQGKKALYFEIPTGEGQMHIHINHVGKKIVQVFVNMPPLGTELASTSAMLGIFVSKYLLHGGEVGKAIKHLNSVRSNRVARWNGKEIHSICQAISEALKLAEERIQNEPND